MRFDVASVIRVLAVLALLQFAACTQTTVNVPSNQAVIVDSDLSIEEAIGTQAVPQEIRANLVLVEVTYYSFDGKRHRGQLVIHKDLQNDIVEIFRELTNNKFPVASVIPVSKYGFSDEASMAANNTSAFNFRVIENTTKLSNHALGRAIDINPVQNPYIRNGAVEPVDAKYDTSAPGTIVNDGKLVSAFKQRGWSWGGDWRNLKDYQHFEKVP